MSDRDLNRDREHCCWIAASTARALIRRKFPRKLGHWQDDIAQDAALLVLLYGTGCAEKKGRQAVVAWLRAEWGDRRYGTARKMRARFLLYGERWLEQAAHEAAQLSTHFALAVRRAVERSPQHETLFGYYWGGHTLHELAAAQCVSPAGAEKRLKRAVAAL